MITDWGLIELLARSEIHRKFGPNRVLRWFKVPDDLGNLLPFTVDRKLVGLVTYARMSPDVEAKYLRGEPLEPEDWNSGDRLWFIDMIAPYGGVHRMIGAMKRHPTFQHDTVARWGRTHGTGKFIHMGEARRELSQAPGPC